MLTNDTIPGEVREYKLADTVELDQMLEYPTEFLNSLHPSGLPPHVLRLKPYAEIMLLRNLNPSIRLMNGTLLQVKTLQDNVIIVRITGGKYKGQDTMILCILRYVLVHHFRFIRKFPNAFHSGLFPNEMHSEIFG